MHGVDKITICVLTYKRPQMLGKLLNSLIDIQTDGLFTYSVIVVDNDSESSGEQVVKKFITDGSMQILYFKEPRRSITLARNRALVQVKDSLIAFIDDDEFAVPEWLVSLYKTLEKNISAAGVLGPVLPYFETPPSRWLEKSGLCLRSSYTTGMQLHWAQTRTGNVLLSKKVLLDAEARFLPRFGTGGGDVDFFKRLMNKGYQFVWCNEAPVYETVPPWRQRRVYFLKRALLQGGNSLKYADNADRLVGRITLFAKTFMAAILYTVSLPVSRLAGDHLFMRYLTKDCHHIGRLMAMVGFSLFKKRNL